MLARIVTTITISCFWEITYLVERKPVTHKIKAIFSIIKHLSHQGIDAGLLGLSCVGSLCIIGPDLELGSMRPGQMFGCISSPFMSAWRDCSCQGALFRCGYDLWSVTLVRWLVSIILSFSNNYLILTAWVPVWVTAHLIILFRTSFFLLICFIFQSQLPHIVNNWHKNASQNYYYY